MGRKKKPIALHKLDGTYRADRHGGTVEAAPGEPECPPSLSAEAKAIWEYLAPLLAECKVLSLQDRELLATYCTAAARRLEAEAEVAKRGAVVKGATGAAVVNPWLQVANKAVEQMTKIGSELGLSPAARARINFKPAEPADDSPLAHLIAQARA